jgi:hypothetical protein
MRPQVKWPSIMVFSLLVVSPVAGQVPLLTELQATMESGVGESLLLANDRVKQEIKLSAEQDSRVKKITRDVFDKYQPQFRRARGDREELLKLAAQWLRETRESVHKALPDILEPGQLKRLDQIQIQVNGIASFKRPDVQQKLKLTDDQKAELLKIGSTFKQEAAETVKAASSAPLRRGLGAIRKVRELKDEADRKAIATLTAEQKKKWDELTGDKIDVKIELPRRPDGRKQSEPRP